MAVGNIGIAVNPASGKDVRRLVARIGIRQPGKMRHRPPRHRWRVGKRCESIRIYRIATELPLRRSTRFGDAVCAAAVGCAAHRQRTRYDSRRGRAAGSAVPSY
jgi:hypothetical protein